MKLNVGIINRRTAANKPSRLEVVSGAWPTLEQVPVNADGNLVVPLQRRIDGHRLRTSLLHIHLQVILQVLTHTRQVFHQWNRQCRQLIGRPDTRLQQQLRRIDRPGADNDLARGTRATLLFTPQVFHLRDSALLTGKS